MPADHVRGYRWIELGERTNGFRRPSAQSLEINRHELAGYRSTNRHERKRQRRGQWRVRSQPHECEGEDDQPTGGERQVTRRVDRAEGERAARNRGDEQRVCEPRGVPIHLADYGIGVRIGAILVHLLRTFSPLEVRLVAIFLIVFGLLMAVSARRACWPLGRPAVFVIGIVWMMVCTPAYWLFGPSSALGRPDEYNAGIPWIYYLTHTHDGGLLAQGYAGGVDAAGMQLLSAQFFSIERLVFSVFPLWIAILVMKAGAVGLAYAGGYRLARTGSQLGRGKAVAVGLLASVGNADIAGAVMGGLGWATALLPWAFWAIALRTGRPRYYSVVAAVALFYSASCSIIHSLPALYFAILMGCVLLPPARRNRVLWGCALYAIVCILNSFDGLLAVVQLLPESSRANTVPVAEPLLRSIAIWLRASVDIMLIPVGLAALLVFAWRRDRFALRALPVLVFVALIGPVLQKSIGPLLSKIEWGGAGSVALSAYRWELLSQGYVLVALIVAMRALCAVKWTALYFSALAVCAAADLVAVDFIDYQGYGGQALFARSARLASCLGSTSEPYRMVTVPTLFAPDTAGAVGIDTFDGISVNLPRRKNLYFKTAVNEPGIGLKSGSAPSHPSYNWLSVSPEARLLSATVNVDALRVANVSFLLSDRQLEDPTLRRIPETCKGAGPLFLYELTNVWPRVFVPGEVRFSETDENNRAFYDDLLRSSQDPIALVSRSELPLLNGRTLVASGYQLEGYHLVRDGVDIDIAPPVRSSNPATRSNSSGLVVVNAPYSRFWRAVSQGRPLDVVPVNGFQTAVILDGASDHVELRYQRPTVHTLVARAVHRLSSAS